MATLFTSLLILNMWCGSGQFYIPFSTGDDVHTQYCFFFKPFFQSFVNVLFLSKNVSCIGILLFVYIALPSTPFSNFVSNFYGPLNCLNFVIINFNRWLPIFVLCIGKANKHENESIFCKIKALIDNNTSRLLSQAVEL